MTESTKAIFLSHASSAASGTSPPIARPTWPTSVRKSGKRIRIAAALALLSVSSMTLAADDGFVVPAWPYPGNPASGAAAPAPPDDTTLLHLPHSSRAFTRAQVKDLFAPPDWYPERHPAMPGIVAQGRKPAVHACAYCHLPDGQGRPENAALAGLPAAYIEAQVADFRSGSRRSAWHGPYLPTDLMLASAESATDAEVASAAAYFSALRLTRRVEVVETDSVPRTREAGWMYVVADGAGSEPLGQRIIEVALDQERHELRDSQSAYRAYVPTGSIARGRRIAQDGPGAPALACASCHGADLRGAGTIPPLAGRSPTYIVRQLLAFRTGARAAAAGEPMRPVVAVMDIEEMIDAAAYAASLAGEPVPPPIAAAELSFLDFLDAGGALAFIESGKVDRFEGRDLAGWKQLQRDRRQQLDADLARVAAGAPSPDDRLAVEAMRRSIAAFDAGNSTEGAREQSCRDAQNRDLGLDLLREALVNCFVEHGNQLRFEGTTIDRGTALQLLHVVREPARRRALFDAFAPLWTALNGRNEPDSPYRRLVAMAAADAARRGSEIDAAARAIGVGTADVERWLVQVLEAWRDAMPPEPVEPWDYRYLNSSANRQLESRIPPESLLPANERFYRELGADVASLRVVFDLEPRPDKSPLAYSDFLARGRLEGQAWQRPIARVVASYPTGGLFSLNELVHEIGHAVHVSAIHTRPAYMDWPDTLFTEAFADVPSWSVHEPAWQRRYLGAAVPEAESLRALFSNVMLDVAWALFEMRMLRDPRADPNAVWTDITSRYLRIVPHPELPWWALRVQLVSDPGYMVNYGLGAVLTAEMRSRTVEAIGPFDAGNREWYGWLSERLLRFGSERDTESLMTGLLGRAVSPDALLRQIERCRSPR